MWLWIVANLTSERSCDGRKTMVLMTSTMCDGHETMLMVLMMTSRKDWCRTMALGGKLVIFEVF